jgi:retron-type reverse transcriptase
MIISQKAKVIKKTYHHILTPIVHIINLSLNQGVFPELMKLSKVIPIFKSGSRHLTKNYRPISLLPVFSKILERIMFNRLYKFLTKGKVLVNNQYGFRRFHSTEQAILDFQNCIIDHLIKKETPIAIFLDLTKAFDTIDHKLLISKLEHYGIRGCALSWFISYLENRTQYTSVNNSESSVKNVRFGVPQGSILGPLLFIAYINDIVNTTDAGKFILFADDTSIVFATGNPDDIQQMNNINLALTNVCQWFNANKLSVNEAKTKFMKFKQKNSNDTFRPTLQLNGKDIDMVQTFKFLGVSISENLTWKDHIKIET